MNQDTPPTATRRQFTRVPFEAAVVLSTFPGKHDCQLVDISLKGALVERTLPWDTKVGEPCSLLIKLAGDGTSIQMVGDVAHVEQNRLGIRCADIDLESITVLRRLLELNLGDEEALHREITAMLTADRPA